MFNNPMKCQDIMNEFLRWNLITHSEIFRIANYLTHACFLTVKVVFGYYATLPFPSIVIVRYFCLDLSTKKRQKKLEQKLECDTIKIAKQTIARTYPVLGHNLCIFLCKIMDILALLLLVYA